MSYTGKLMYHSKREKARRLTEQKKAELRAIIEEAKAKGYALEEVQQMIRGGRDA